MGKKIPENIGTRRTVSLHMNNIFLAILLTSATPPFEVQTLDGRTLAGALVELTAERLTLAAEAAACRWRPRDS